MPANYHSLMLRAISLLPVKTKEFRSLQYDRSRKAIRDKLSSPTSGFSNKQVEDEIFALNRAIERVEWELRNERLMECVDAARFVGEMDDVVVRMPEFTRTERELIFHEYGELFRTSLLNKRPRLNAGKISEQYTLLLSKFEEIESRIAVRSGSADADQKHEEATVRRRLADTASPKPTLDVDGKLHVTRNDLYDAPSTEQGLENLPIRQRAVIDTIILGLPENSPTHLRKCLNIYKEELAARHTKPILGILEDAMSILSCDVEAQEIGRDWLEPGIHKAFEILQSNHSLLMSYYPLNEERSRLYDSIKTRNEHLFGTGEVASSFQNVARAAEEARVAGWATKDFVLVADKMLDFARTISALHYSRSDGRNNFSPAAKIILLSGLGFFIGTYNLLGSTNSIFGPHALTSLLNTLAHAVESLARIISP